MNSLSSCMGLPNSRITRCTCNLAFQGQGSTTQLSSLEFARLHFSVCRVLECRSARLYLLKIRLLWETTGNSFTWNSLPLCEGVLLVKNCLFDCQSQPRPSLLQEVPYRLLWKEEKELQWLNFISTPCLRLKFPILVIPQGFLGTRVLTG